jgi:cell division protein FtsI/penicillin-binding protein 2
MRHIEHRLRRAAAAAVTLGLLTGGLTGCSKDDPGDTLKQFLDGWQSGNLSKVGFITAAGAPVSADEVTKQLTALKGDLAKQPVAVSKVGDAKTSGDNATTAIKVNWTLPGGVPWSYQSAVRLTKQKSKTWQVIWEPAIVQGDLTAGDQLKLRRTSAKRASILDGTGQPLVSTRPVVVVGVTPERVTDVAQLQKDLATAFTTINAKVELSTLADKIKQAKPDAFVELVTLRQPDYDKIRSKVESLKGTVTRDENRELAPTRAFARALLGTADAATRDDIDAHPGEVAQGDVVGHGGLQQKYDSVLRGTTGLSVVIARTAPDNSKQENPVFSTKPVDGKPLKTTLDIATQNAADQALSTEKQPGSLVAIRVTDGAVLAVANGPDGGGVDTALTGQVPPGSTFKTISAYGLLQQKAVQADTPVDCPATVDVNGQKFKNSHDEAFGKVPFHVDYAKSCNTAFVGLAPKLGADGLHKAAAALGLGAPWNMGVDAFSGKVSPADSPPELAAAAFGQGATVVSPIAMASATAAIARGQFKQPKLVLDPAPQNPAPDGQQLDADAVGALRSMMGEVVTAGTGTALKNAPGGKVFGKTGTAEFQTGSADTHSWFIGYQGDIAFAVMIQKGGAGSEAAVPAVLRFLTALKK